MSIRSVVGMSMNATFVARQGKKVYEFQTYQTPTKVSYEILKAKDPIQEYKNWVLTFLDNPSGAEHFERLDAWVKYVKEQGVRVEVKVS